MSVRMRHTRAHTGNRRSHHGLEEPRVSTCSHCGAEHLRHRMCGACGHYKGRLVTDVALKAEKKAEKQKAKQREMGAGESSENLSETEEEVRGEAKPLTPEGLSKK